MIIVCPECSTKFNVSSDRIPDGGTKVRCARCKHVFLAERPAPPIPAEEPAPFVAEDPETETFDAGDSEDSDFSYDRFQELDSSTPEAESFSFGTETGAQESSTAMEQTEEDFTFGDSVSPIEKVIITAEEENSGAENIPAAVEPQDVQEEVSAAPPAEPEPPAQQIPGKKGGPVSSIIRILLLLILAIVIIGGVFVYMNGTDQLNQTIQQIFGQQIDRPVQTGQITLVKLEGQFIQNEQVGELFRIRGEAINDFSEPRAAIQVKGVIFDQNGKPLLQKTVFCGNPIPDDKLQALSFEELEKIMGNQFGEGLSNMKVASKQAIPFDIVFKDLPKNLSEFSVKVTSSKPVTE